MECRKANIEYRNLAEMEYQADQAECVSRCLDELDIPKKEGGEDLSLWGRVFIYGVINADQAVEHGENLQQLRIAGNSPVTPDGWIPVSERMPEDGEHAIVFHPRDGVMQITFFFAYGKWWDSQEDDGGIPKSYFTHWQPLPAAPKQEVK
ncbi:hypothetical protein SDC9_183678 [bioreactor metagenome]|uniref:DUF551 domain-containing protein n=1 Tax=bioreactor metagenome TaxID=1076179 RepID=A0A645HAV5_9ZZZZ